MSSGLLTLVFPQWQGSGKRKYLYHGAKVISGELPAGSRHKVVDVNLDDDIRLENGIWGYSQILDQLICANGIIEESKPARIFLVGGDCGTEVAPVSYLNRLYEGDLALLWLDAHGDLNSPSTSHSHNFHGMPLRCLLGEGEGSLVRQCFSKLSPSQVILGGVRDLDPPEAEFIEENGITCLNVGDIEADPRVVSRTIREKGFHNVYVHIDVDVLDSGKCPWALCPAPDGMSTETLTALLRDIKAKLGLVGISILELKATDNMDTRPLKELVKFCSGI